MLESAGKIIDGEAIRVAAFFAASTGMTIAHLNLALTSVVLIGNAIYIWRKVLRKRKP